MGRPPRDEDLGFLRRSTVLAALCHKVYTFKQSDVGSTSYVPVPVGDILGDSVAISTKLLYFR